MSDYIVKPVQKALQVLKCISGHQEPMSLKDISICTNMPKTSVLRYLRTFEEAGMIAYDLERSLYRLDTRLVGMIDHAAGLARLREICLPYMHELRRSTGETVNLAVMEGSEIVYLEILEGTEVMPNHARVGGRHPAHTTALGKVMLAFMPEEVRTAALPRVLRRRTEQSIHEQQRLLSDLDATMHRGYALDQSENIDNATCIGAPIIDISGAVIAAISISAPAARRRDGWSRDVSTRLMRSATAISRELRYQVPARQSVAA